MMLPVVMISCRTFFHPLFTHFECALHVEWQIENCNVLFSPTSSQYLLLSGNFIGLFVRRICNVKLWPLKNHTFESETHINFHTLSSNGRFTARLWERFFCVRYSRNAMLFTVMPCFVRCMGRVLFINDSFCFTFHQNIPVVYLAYNFREQKNNHLKVCAHAQL